MAIAFRIPRPKQSDPAVDGSGRMTAAFFRTFSDILDRIEDAFNRILVIPEIQLALDNAEQAVTAAQQAVVVAQSAADNAQAAADAANTAAAATAREQALVNSYTSPADGLLSATPTTITIAAHTRAYADGTSVAVDGGSVAATAAGDTDYISYVDPTRAGGAVNYQVSTTAPTQGMDVHVVAGVVIPATGTASGGSGPRRPGYVTAEP